MVIIGQDPTILNGKDASIKRQKEITSTLDLNNTKGNLRKYCEHICKCFNYDIDKDIYATNLCKCIFKEKPAYNRVLDKHSEQWIPLLKEELSVFSDKVIVITLGQPLIRQLIHSNKKEVKFYWNYIGKSKSNGDFKYCESTDNKLEKKIYPLPHQPTWSSIKFYSHYFNDYLNFIKIKEIGK